MIVIVSWYADGSGQPRVSFHDITPLGVGVSTQAVGELVTHLRDIKHQECMVYDVESVALLLYDSTASQKERQL